MKFENGLFIFHRDFRITDNVGLLEASSQCKRVYTCFIFTPEQVGKSNHYRSDNAIQFMIESLEDLRKSIQSKNGELIILHGEHKKCIANAINTLNINCVFFNKDYSPYAIERDNEIIEYCNRHQIKCLPQSDYYLYEPGTVLNGSGGYYKKFTPFYEQVLKIEITKPNKRTITNLSKTTLEIENSITLRDAFSKFTHNNDTIAINGGRYRAKQMLTRSLITQAKYSNERDFLFNPTSGLSAPIKFGCISVREVYDAFKQKFGTKSDIIRQLIWREFYAHVLYGYPDVLGQSYQPSYRKIRWSTSEMDFHAWKNGETGFPVVDACMRQLNESGYMHNRGRMIVANFLVKTLLLDWRLGERYFAKKLVDYDPASNNGNWQGISGTGVDLKPYFRDMNPWIQSAKFDKDCVYIKKWVPELANVEPRDIHKWYIMCNDTKYHKTRYYTPIVDYDEQKKKMLELYKKYV
jgi:deoxyribodipyrimidine photo-lyase